MKKYINWIIFTQNRSIYLSLKYKAVSFTVFAGEGRGVKTFLPPCTWAGGRPPKLLLNMLFTKYASDNRFFCKLCFKSIAASFIRILFYKNIVDTNVYIASLFGVKPD